jgi:origin recognition complex subunit 5
MHFQDESLLNPGVLATPTITTTSTAASSTFTKPAHPHQNQQPNGPATGTGPGPIPAAKKPPHTHPHPDLASLLPPTARLLLLASYLASHNAARHDLALFSTHYHGRRRRRGGGGGGGGGGSRHKHRKIARKLLGAHVFVLERMLAIFAAVRGEWEDRAQGQGQGQRQNRRYGGAWGRQGDGGEEEEEEADEGPDADICMAIATLASLRLLVRVGGGGELIDCGGKWRVNVGWEVVRGLGRSMGVEVEDWLIE